MLAHQRIAMADADVVPIHEGRHLGHFGEAVLLVDADDGLVVGRHASLLVRLDHRLELQRQLGEKVACAAGVVNGFRRHGAGLDNLLQRQAHQDEAADRHRREELAFALLHTLVEKALEHVAEKLVVLAWAAELDVLPHLDDAQQHIGVLIEQPLVVDVDQREIVVGEKLLLLEQVPHRTLRGIGVLPHEAQRVAHVVLVDVGDPLAQKAPHAGLVELLQAVEQVEVRVVGDTLPVELEVVRVLQFIDQLAQEQVHQFVEGVFAAGDVVLAQDGGVFVVLALLVHRVHRLQIGARVLALADLVGRDVVLEQALGAEVELVRVAPDGMPLLDVGGLIEGLEMGVVCKVAFVVAVGDDVRRVAHIVVIEVGGVQAQEVRFADLLCVAEELVAVL